MDRFYPDITDLGYLEYTEVFCPVNGEKACKKVYWSATATGGGASEKSIFWAKEARVSLSRAW